MSVTALAGTGGLRFADRLARLLSRPCSILYLGASVTAQQKSYCHALHEALCRVTGHDHTFRREAMGGGSSAFVLAAMLRVMRDEGAHFDIVFLDGVTGDLNLLVPDTVVPAVVAAAADAVRAQDGELCVLKLPRMDRPADHPITLAYDMATAQLGLPVIDISAFGRPAEGANELARHFLRDGVHTSETGAELIGAALLARLLAPDTPWPTATPAEGFAEPLRGRLSGLRLILKDLSIEPAAGLREDVFHAPVDGAVYPVLVAPAGVPLTFGFQGYIGCFLFVSAPDSSLMDLDFHGVVRRTSLLDRHGHFPHLHMKPIFRDFQASQPIRMTALDAVPEPHPVPEAHRHRLLADKALRFLGVLGVAER